MGTVANINGPELKFTKKATMSLFLKELSPKIHRSIGGVGYIIKLEEEEGFFEITIYDLPLDFLKPLYKEIRKEHIYSYKKITFEEFSFENLNADQYVDFVGFILSELDILFIGN